MIRSDSAAVQAFWAAFCEQTGVSPDATYHPRTFSDPRNSTVTDEITELARQGKNGAPPILRWISKRTRCRNESPVNT